MSRHGRDTDDGFTLVEVLVAVVILGIVGAVFASTVVQSIRVDERTRDRADAQEAVALSMERMTRQIRVAAPLVSVSTTQFVADVYPDQPSGTTLRRRHTFTLAGGTLTEQVQSFSPATATTATSTSSRVLAHDLDLTASRFTARDRAGATSTQPSKVASIEVSLRHRTGSTKPFEATTTVFLRNYQG